jgi:hypothetical protein
LDPLTCTTPLNLEGLLAADNAIVMAVMVKHLPPEQRKKALFYGLLGRCSGGKCLTITAITIALSAANKPSKNTKTTSTHKWLSIYHPNNVKKLCFTVC